MRVAIDMDEVIADTHAAKRALYRALGFDCAEADLTGRTLSDLAPAEITAAVEAEMHKGVFFADLPVIEGAAEALAALGRRHEIFIATAAMEYPASCAHKIAWMARHFPAIDPMRLVLCGDKSVVRADVLIDDSPRHFERFAGIGVCFSAAHNAGADVPWRLDRWSGAEALLDGIAGARAA